MGRVDLEALAARVSDRESIDWTAIERSEPSDAEARVIRNLKLVDSLASVSSRVEVTARVPPRMAATLIESITPSVFEPKIVGREPLVSWGGLKLHEKIGEGGYGEVFRAHDPNLDRDVALKLIRDDDALAAQVLQEGRALARVIHPNVVTVHGAERHGGRVGLWMELVRGHSLAEVLTEQGPFGAGEAALLGLDLSRALAAVHTAGLVHRDVKAQNAMREQGGRVVLMDFGAAFSRDALQVSNRASISGTPLYIAPELFDGAKATVASDIYSLGVLLFHLVTGAFPVPAATLAELRERHAAGRADLLRDVRPDLPDEFVRVVQRAIDPDPARRFATAGEMEQALTRCLGLDAPPSVSADIPIDPPVPPSRPWLPAMLGVASVLAILAVAVGLRWPGGAADPTAGASAAAPSPVSTRVATGAPSTDLAHGAEPEIREPEASAGSTASGLVAPPATGRAAPPPATAADSRPVAPVRSEVLADNPYTIAASLYRRDSTNRQDRLESGASLDADDKLWLEMTVSREAWVYVINRDDLGNGYALFPLPTLDRQNPLPAGERVVIPGEIDGRAQYWGVSVAGGREEILILASPERQLQFEAEMAGLAQPTPLAIELDGLDDLPVRGIGAIVPGRRETRPAESAERLFDMADVLVGSGVERADGVWFRKVTLVNPESW